MELTSRNVTLCEMSAELFSLACKKGYDSEDFVNKVMKSEEGQLLYSNDCIDMWLGAEYIMEGIEKEVRFKQGRIVKSYIMEWIGYLIKCWSITYPNETSLDIIRQAPFSVLVESYLGFHVMSFEDAILNFKEIFEESKTS